MRSRQPPGCDGTICGVQPERRVESDREWTFGVALGLLIAASVVPMFIAGFAAFACSSGEEIPWSLEADLCDGYAGSYYRGFTWWLAVLWPFAAFVTSQFVPALRRHRLVVATSLAILGMAFWIATAAVVIDF